MLGLDGGEKSENFGNAKRTKKKEDNLKVSSIDFVGLSFSDKKSSRELPAGLVPVVDPFLDGEFPEVEIIVGDTSKFKDATASTAVGENPDLYKPKVSTWGVFPRPSNISKAVRFLYFVSFLVCFSIFKCAGFY